MTTTENAREQIAAIIRENVGGAMILLPKQADKAAELILNALASLPSAVPEAAVEGGAEIEARRMLAVAFADVSPDDASRIRRANDLDPLQRAAVDAVAAIVSRYDDNNPD